MAYVFAFKTPPGYERGPVVFVIVLEKENLDRMSAGDPFDLQLRKYSPYLPEDTRASAIDIVLAYEEEVTALLEFQRDGALDKLLKWLERGRRIVPGDGLAPTPLREH